MAQFLPRELVDAVIDELHTPRDLKALSLTCHSFSLSTRRILFRQMKLTPKQLHPDVVQRFHELCTVSPHIPPLVQILCLDGYASGPTFLAVFDVISWVLQFMQNLKVIKLHHVTIGNWIQSTVSSPSFREIHLTNVFFHENGFRQMCALVQGSPDLERLFVHNNHRLSVFGGNATSQLDLDHTRHRPRIRHLSVESRHLSNFIEAILDPTNCFVSIEELKWFHFTLSTATDFQHLNRILQLASGTLRILSLRVNPSRTRFLNALHLLEIGHLRQVSFMMSRVRAHQCLQWWIQSLRRVAQSSQPPALQVMNIELDSFYHWNPHLSQWPWSELDEIFSSPPFDAEFQMLTITSWRVWGHKSTPEEAASRRAVRGHFEAQFSRLAGKSKFSISGQ